MVKQVLESYGKIDILVNNAGAAFGGRPFLEQTEEDWDKNIDLNLKGTMFCAQVVLPGMMERKWGKIVNISSSGAKLIFPAVSTYPIAKAAVYYFICCPEPLAVGPLTLRILLML